MTVYTILDYYKPRKGVKAKEIGSYLTSLTESLGLTPLPLGSHRLHKGPWKSKELHADVMTRMPEKSADLGWHRDGDITGAETDCYLVLWCNKCPTEIRAFGNEALGNDVVVRPNPYEVILVYNQLHRRPADCPRLRKTFRQRVVANAIAWKYISST